MQSGNQTVPWYPLWCTFGNFMISLLWTQAYAKYHDICVLASISMCSEVNSMDDISLHLAIARSKLSLQLLETFLHWLTQIGKHIYYYLCVNVSDIKTRQFSILFSENSDFVKRKHTTKLKTTTARYSVFTPAILAKSSGWPGELSQVGSKRKGPGQW